MSKEKKNTFSMNFEYLLDRVCPLCTSDIAGMSKVPEYGGSNDVYEEIRFLCGCKIQFKDGRKHVYAECPHLKTIMAKILNKKMTIEELLTSDGALQRELGMLRQEMGEREKRVAEYRERKIAERDIEMREEMDRKKNLYGFQ